MSIDELGSRKAALLIEVKVDDFSRRGKIKPLVIVGGESGTNRTIDLFDELKKNPSFLHDPIMVNVIKRWLRIIEARHLVPDEVYRAAKNHIQKLSESLSEGAKNRGIPKKHVLLINLSANEFNCIHEVIELLRTPEVKGSRDWQAKCNSIRKILIDKIESLASPQLKIELERCLELVLGFTLSSHRPRKTNRDAWYNSYIAWRNNMDTKSVKTYKHELTHSKQITVDPLVIRLLNEQQEYRKVVTDLREELYPDHLELMIPLIKKGKSNIR